MSKVIRRPGGLPQRADDHFDSPPVQITHRAQAHVSVKTFCGVTIRCRVIESRGLDDSPIYWVKPTENKWKEFKDAGVPMTPDNAMDPFTAFDWQITPCRDT